MSRSWIPSAIALLSLHTASLIGQEPHVSSKAPPDQPVAVNDEQQRRLEAAIAPYNARARAGLPRGERSRPRQRLRPDLESNSRGSRLGDRHSVAEREILDWLITRPDGSEEGNVVGKFLDTYRP